LPDAGLRAAELAAVRAAPPSTGPAIAYAVAVVVAGPLAALALFLLIRPRPAPGPDRQADLLLDLHRRSQRLVHSQLRLFDAMERRDCDEETLADLFQADHLATRVRRNVEKAISLAGGMPGRRWRRPMPLVEVVRGAAAEVADYVRVSTSQVEPAGLTGTAVTDVTHLLAELIDNAATCSPPETRVGVVGARDADGGYTVTITDAGAGMTDAELATARAVLTESEPRADGVFRGFFAAGRFAARQNVVINVDHGTAGGVVAKATLPATLLTDPAEAGAGPAGPPLSRVARMRARLGEVSDAAPKAVDVTVVDAQSQQSGQQPEAQ
jgi:anti-sigma regulatory factor (Ser/Thr protein kinase)